MRILLVALVASLALPAVSADSDPVRLMAHTDERPPAIHYADLPDREGAQPPPEGPAVPTIQSGLGPGSAMLMYNNADGSGGGSICTAAFLLRDPITADYYLATAGHCLVTDADDPTPYMGPKDAANLKGDILICISSCMMNALQLGTYVDIPAAGSFHPVAFAISAGVGDDFGIVRLPAEVKSHLRPWMPQWGGPTGYNPSAAGNQIAHYGHGSYCCPVVGAVASRTSADQGRLGTSLGSDSTSFSVFGHATGGDSGSAVSRAVPSATRGVQGTEAVGVLTHGIASLFDGTTMEHGLALVHLHTGLKLELVLQDDPLSAQPKVQYTLGITSPTSGKGVKVPADLEVRGAASVQGGNMPVGARVELSVDDAEFQNPVKAVGIEDWSGTVRIESKGMHTVRARLVDGEKTLAESSVEVRGDGSSGTKSPATKSPSGTSSHHPEETPEEQPTGSAPTKSKPTSQASPGPAFGALVVAALAAFVARRR